jgi:signal recognition particle GTPase
MKLKTTNFYVIIIKRRREMIKTVRLDKDLFLKLENYLEEEGLKRSVSDEITDLLRENYLKPNEEKVKEELKKLYSM